MRKKLKKLRKEDESEWERRGRRMKKRGEEA